jgi:hypothetical protein
MSRETLKQGYERLLLRLYEPESYFGRLFHGYRNSPAFRRRRAAMDAAATGRRGAAARIGALADGVLQASRLARALARARLLGRLGGAYVRVWRTENRPLGRDALPFAMFVHCCVMHWHFYNVVRLRRKNGFGAVAADAPAQAAAETPAAA